MNLGAHNKTLVSVLGAALVVANELAPLLHGDAKRVVDMVVVVVNALAVYLVPNTTPAATPPASA